MPSWLRRLFRGHVHAINADSVAWVDRSHCAGFVDCVDCGELAFVLFEHKKDGLFYVSAASGGTWKLEHAR